MTPTLAGLERPAAVEEFWASFVRNLPSAKLEVEGLSGHILRGEQGYVIFMAAEQDVLVPAHHHGVQWGVVLEGEMDLTVGESTRTYTRGDVHFVPAGVEHAAVLRAGWKGIYVFERAPGRVEPTRD